VGTGAENAQKVKSRGFLGGLHASRYARHVHEVGGAALGCHGQALPTLNPSTPTIQTHPSSPTLARSCGSEWRARQECRRLRLSSLLGRQTYTSARASGTRSVRISPLLSSGCCCCWPSGGGGATAAAADPCITPGVLGGLLCVWAGGCAMGHGRMCCKLYR